MLPNEMLLQVLLFADYKTLVLSKLTGRRFLRLTVKFAEELARRQSFHVTFCTSDVIMFYNATTGARRRIRYEPGSQVSLATACRKVDEVIGPHAVAKLTVSRDWDMPDAGVIFEPFSPMKYAEIVVLYGCGGSTTGGNSDAFMSNFVGMKSLHLCLDNDTFQCLSLRFLRQEAANELRLISVPGSRSVCRNSVEALVRECARLPHHRGGDALELDFSECNFPDAFCLRIIELLEYSGRELICRMTTRRYDRELVLDESEYTVDEDGGTMRYASEKSGIVVDVQDNSIVIQSNADVPRKKHRDA